MSRVKNELCLLVLPCFMHYVLLLFFNQFENCYFHYISFMTAYIYHLKIHNSKQMLRNQTTVSLSR